MKLTTNLKAPKTRTYDLHQHTLIVGPAGSGKSSILQALSLVNDAGAPDLLRDDTAKLAGLVAASVAADGARSVTAILEDRGQQATWTASRSATGEWSVKKAGALFVPIMPFVDELFEMSEEKAIQALSRDLNVQAATGNLPDIDIGIDLPETPSARVAVLTDAMRSRKQDLARLQNRPVPVPLTPTEAKAVRWAEGVRLARSLVAARAVEVEAKGRLAAMPVNAAEGDDLDDLNQRVECASALLRAAELLTTVDLPDDYDCFFCGAPASKSHLAGKVADLRTLFAEETASRDTAIRASYAMQAQARAKQAVEEARLRYVGAITLFNGWQKAHPDCDLSADALATLPDVNPMRLAAAEPVESDTGRTADQIEAEIGFIQGWLDAYTDAQRRAVVAMSDDIVRAMQPNLPARFRGRVSIVTTLPGLKASMYRLALDGHIACSGMERTILRVAFALALVKLGRKPNAMILGADKGYDPLLLAEWMEALEANRDALIVLTSTVAPPSTPESWHVLTLGGR